MPCHIPTKKRVCTLQLPSTQTNNHTSPILITTTTDGTQNIKNHPILYKFPFHDITSRPRSMLYARRRLPSNINARAPSYK